MIKVILFDFDGVLSNVSKASAVTAKYLSDKSELPFDELLAKKWAHRIDVNSGKKRETDLWREIFAEYGKEFKDEWAIEAYSSTPIDKKMMDYALKLTDKFKIAIFSDNFYDRFDAIRQKNPNLNSFDEIILSEDIGSGKEDSLIFKYACDKFKVSPDECIFIDDVKKTLDFAQKLGFHTLYFDDKIRDYDKLHEEIEKIVQENKLPDKNIKAVKNNINL